MRINMVDLHLHLDGSLRPETVLELAREQKLSLPADTLEDIIKYLRVPEECKSLTEYLRCFELPLMVMQTAEAMERVSYELVEDLAKQGLEYAEIRFAPQLSTKLYMTQDQVVQAAISGLNRALANYPSIQAAFLLCFMRGEENEEENESTLKTAEKYLGQGVCAVDLAGAEALFKTSKYKRLFQRVREMKIPYTIHAGEADGPESIECALDFGAKRIGHGVRAVESERLLKRLLEERITLEICPISNFQTKAVGGMERDFYAHPIRRLYDMGIRVTVNTDNMTVSNTCLQKEYDFIKKYYYFTEDEIQKMNQYALEAAFGR